ncbi:metallophosphoesterase family protein [Rubritalea spongiae]|uniref:Metallophosphoesterase family protein n=1 Tax=Rubritalea spongiae TaxID=430797 RepID=A0ABW5DZ97_9BACT
MYQILQFSDPHFGAVNLKQAEAAVAMANELAPDLMLLPGDFTMRARKREMKAAKAWLCKLPTPQFTLPGNHDVPLLNQPIDRFFSPFRRYKKYINVELEPTMDLPCGRLLGFNSSTPFGLHIDWSRGFLSPFQGQRIETGFEGNHGYNIVAFHHPLHRKNESSRVLISPVGLIKKSLAMGKVDIVFAGHFHQSYVGVIELNHQNRNLIVSQASTVCSRRTKGEAAGFHLIRLSEVKVEILRFKWENSEFKHDMTYEFEKKAERWTQLY